MKNRVTGIGGVFFKSENPGKLKEWYQNRLGLPIDKYGCSFIWRPENNPEKRAMTQWSPFESKTTYFEPSTKNFMMNYRDENLVELLKVLKEEGVEIVGEIQEYDYGKFGWIMDPEGNKIELWEPIDEALL